MNVLTYKNTKELRKGNLNDSINVEAKIQYLQWQRCKMQVYKRKTPDELEEEET